MQGTVTPRSHPGQANSLAAPDREQQSSVYVSPCRLQGHGPSSASRGNPASSVCMSSGSTSTPISFQSLACRLCQGGGLPAACTCELFQRWGSWVVVGRCGRSESERRADSVMGEAHALPSVVDVVVDRDTMVGSPFVGGSNSQLCEAFDELLGHLLTSDIEFDRLAKNYQRCIDEHQASMESPGSHLLLREVAAKHDVQLHCCAERFQVEHVRAWVGFHAGLLRSGRCLRLLCHCVEGSCPLWSCHAQSLAGALTWAVTTLDCDFTQVSASTCPIHQPTPLLPRAACQGLHAHC